ncbi:hypothetical protein PPACK8108_LOCUS9141 [Phakopsora pachyrhizi]|uniref:Uncharacterized protein n=1 Tax=Phakopsora pachyrhizi TaxID=170000 RepID=A0AAV0AYT2_PHAPC|nr:hypothetical protein PPACK8108_LOCUS9141 [Phakopsora pachyrhizi]
MSRLTEMLNYLTVNRTNRKHRKKNSDVMEKEVNQSIDESDKLKVDRQEQAAKKEKNLMSPLTVLLTDQRGITHPKNQCYRSAHIQSGHEAKNDSHSRWQRAGLFATELVDRSSSQSSSLPNSPALDQSSPNSNCPSRYQQKTMDRRNYLVKINEEGKLIWKTGEIPSSYLDLYSTHSSYKADPRHYSVQKPSKSKLAAKIKSCIHQKHMMDHLLRKPLSVNTWIFVADKNGNLYVGIKHPGKFQHSSFLAGSYVLAAGLLKVREALEKYGTLTKKKHELEDKIKNLLSISKLSKGEDLDGEKSKDQKRESKAKGRRTEELIRLERTRLKEEYQKNSRIKKIAEQSGDEERKRILKSIRLDSGGDDDEEGDDKKDLVYISCRIPASLLAMPAVSFALAHIDTGKSHTGTNSVTAEHSCSSPLSAARLNSAYYHPDYPPSSPKANLVLASSDRVLGKLN